MSKVLCLGKNSEIIQQQNRLLVLRLIRESRVISRVSIAEITGLKQATITNIINELISKEYIKETGLIKGKNGRRVQGIELNDEKIRILIARITSGYYAVGIYNLNGTCFQAKKVFWNGENSFSEKMKHIRDDLLQLRKSYGKEKLMIGAGIVIQESAMNAENHYTGVKESLDLKIENYFTEELNMDVYVNTMSNMSAYFEWSRLGSEKDNMHALLCLMIGYSVDLGVIFNGKILQGEYGNTGYFGHSSIDMNGPPCECGNCGCITNYISVHAVIKRFNELLEIYPKSKIGKNSNIRDIIKAYYDGELIARVLYEEVAEKIGVIIANLVNQFNSDEIIMGDELPNNDEFLELVKRYAKKRLPEKRYNRVNIKIFREERKTEEDVGMKGMCLYVMNEQIKKMELK